MCPLRVCFRFAIANPELTLSKHLADPERLRADIKSRPWFITFQHPQVLTQYRQVTYDFIGCYTIHHLKWKYIWETTSEISIRNSRYIQYFCKISVRISLHTYFSKDIVHILFNKCLGFIAKKIKRKVSLPCLTKKMLYLQIRRVEKSRIRVFQWTIKIIPYADPCSLFHEWVNTQL